MPTGQDLGDFFAAAGGSPVNRPQLNAFVANSQARNGLLSAQTQDAMIKAAQAQEEQGARENVYNDLIGMGAKPSEAMLGRDIGVGALGNAEVMAKALGMFKLGYGTPDEQVRGHQMATGNLATPPAVSGNYLNVPGTTGAYAGAPPVQQTPLVQAQTAETNALAGLNTHRNLSPQDFRNAPIFGTLSDQGKDALTQAVAEGRLDPTRVNARTAPILAQIEMNAPGTNFNRLHADAALQANATFQQRAMSVDMLPGLLQHVTQLGKQLNDGAGYSDLKTVGQMQQFLNGQLNDPAYTEYMTARNDTLLRLASVMRGVGMSDQAHRAEVEAMAPTLAPFALDAWLKGQMSVVKPLLDRQNRITHLGEPGQGTPTLGATPTSSTAAPAGPAPLGSAPPGAGGYGAPPVGGAAASAPAVGSYPNEAAALAAGHKVGDHVIINGVSGTLQ